MYAGGCLTLTLGHGYGHILLLLITTIASRGPVPPLLLLLQQ